MKNNIDPQDGIVRNITWLALISRVRPGDSGYHVLAVQEQLKRWGFNVDLTRVFDPQTGRALDMFQTMRGYTKIGFVDERTWLLLVSGCNSSIVEIYGLDLSYYQGNVSASSFVCLRNMGYQFAVLQARRSSGLNQYILGDIKNAWAAGFKYVDVYIFPTVNGNDPYNQVIQTLDFLGNARYNRVWLDIEGDWPSNTTRNAWFVGELIRAVEDRGKIVGMYATRTWKTIFGDYSVSHYPLWYAHYDGDPSFQDFSSYGGWDRPRVKQYMGTTSMCKTQIDQNWAITFNF